MNWIEAQVRFQKMQENGRVKKVTESYIVDALSLTEAEVRIIEEVTPYISGDFTVSAVKKSNISEILFGTSGDKFYKVKVICSVIDTKTLSEKTKPFYILVQASNIDAALDNTYRGLRATSADFKIESIAASKIIDVFTHRTNTDA